MITLAFFSFFTFFFFSFFLYNYTSFFIAKEDNNKLDYFLFSIQLELKLFFWQALGFLFLGFISHHLHSSMLYSGVLFSGRRELEYIGLLYTIIGVLSGARME